MYFLLEPDLGPDEHIKTLAVVYLDNGYYWPVFDWDEKAGGAWPIFNNLPWVIYPGDKLTKV